VNGQDDDIITSCLVKPKAKTDTAWLLIKHGADVTTREKAHSTPLHMASSVGSVETVRLLIEHGANVTAQNETHSTPLHLASSLVSTTTA
jgi:ankyrin repeat protein